MSFGVIDVNTPKSSSAVFTLDKPMAVNNYFLGKSTPLWRLCSRESLSPSCTKLRHKN